MPRHSGAEAKKLLWPIWILTVKSESRHHAECLDHILSAIRLVKKLAIFEIIALVNSEKNFVTNLDFNNQK